MTAPSMLCYIAQFKCFSDTPNESPHLTMAAYSPPYFRKSISTLLLLMALVFISSQPALAQFSESYNFLKAVRDRDGDAATTILNKPGTVIANTRDAKTGETALHIVVNRRDSVWVAFLIQKGANPNLKDNSGMTPLMLATMLRYFDGVETLLELKARVDEPNNSGETPLIRAVQLRDIEMVRLLLKHGANPDRQDTIAGFSARDYAASDIRDAAILSELENAGKARADKTSTPVFGPNF